MMKRLFAIVKHAAQAILERPFRYIPIFIELCVACVLFGLVSANLHRESAYSSVMKRVAEHNSIYQSTV